ncbi:MAG: dihydroorotase [Deltaproteobacteria bacterium]|nr:dihydroorotase [Deltaproteobacteria bacterium]
MDFVIRGARVVDPAQGLDARRDIAVEGGRILAVKASIKPGGRPVLDAGGLCAMPGLVDVHVHLREPGQEHKETVATGTRAAAAGGFTSVACMPNTSPVNDDPAVTRYILDKAAAHGVCRVYPIGAITRGLKGEELSDMGELARAGCPAVTDDGKPVSSAFLMRRAMEYANGFGLTVVSHCEDLDLANGGSMNESAVSSVLGIPAIPAEAEEVMVARDVLLARRTGARLHLAHLSTRGSVELLQWAKRLGLRVTGETAPHYFTLTDEAVRTFDSVYKMNPPLREAADLAAVTAALADGTFDAVATDHAPHAWDDKEMEFEAAANGVIGLETSLGLALRLCDEGKVPLARVVAALTCGPARALGIPGGTLAPGSPADVVLVDLGAEWTVDPSTFQSKARNCPFAGMKLKGRAVQTLVGGRTVFKAGRITAGNLETAEIVG